MSRIKKISGANLLRNAIMIPAVTNHDDADITDLEAFRVLTNKENEKAGIKVTMLAFLIKACGDRGVRQARRHRQAGAEPDHGGVGQGIDGNPVLGRRRGARAEGQAR